jgi:hypothetical protein
MGDVGPYLIRENQYCAHIPTSNKLIVIIGRMKTGCESLAADSWNMTPARIVQHRYVFNRITDLGAVSNGVQI